MNTPFTKAQVEAYQNAMKAVDPIAECIRRWPDFRFEERQERWPAFSRQAGAPKRYVARALWTRDGREYGLSKVAGTPTATSKQIAEAKEFIARHALFNDEYRRLV